MVNSEAASIVEKLRFFDPQDSATLALIEDAIQRYPYFLWLRFYHLKYIHQQQPEKFEKTLSKTALATYNRKLLYQWIAKEIEVTKIEKPIPLATETPMAVPETPELKVDVSQQQSISQLLEKEKMGFSEWARFLNAQKNVEERVPDLKDKFDLIDDFLNKQPKIVPDKNVSKGVDLSSESWTSTDELMTETLAKVLVKQKKYGKALQAYKILCLKYPEKNSLFAVQIKEIKRLQKLKD